MIPALILTGSYDSRLVALSVLIAVLASYAALDLAGRVTSAQGSARLLWLSGGAVAMGIGIWSMHYIGMLALRLPIAVEYDWPTVLLSLLAAILASAVALFVVSRQRMGLFRALAGSVFMGTGIAAMHYIGMAAMRLAAMCRYSPLLVTLSVVLAIVISFVALWLTFHFRGETSAGGWKKTVSALVMGAAIPVMHYTGMAAASFETHALTQQSLRHAVSISSLSIAGIIIVTFMALGLALSTSFVDRRFSVQAMELELSEKCYRQIVETVLDAFVGMDSEGLITDWNAQAVTTFGWSRSEALGRDLSQMIIPDRHRNAHKQGLRHFLASAEGPILNKRIETTALHRDGREFPVELTVSPIRAGAAHRFSAFVRDVTERKQVEAEREKAKEAAEAANRAKSEFLANMSHEIRTPLNGVMGMTDLALGTALTSEQREYLDTVKLSADSLLIVINDILDFSKIEAGKVDLEMIDFDIRDSLESTLKTLALRADEKGVELLCEIAAEVPEGVRGDPSRLRQIVVNLVGNAIKFTDEGEVALKVQVDAGQGEARMLHFTIFDTGIGIPPEKLKTIFDPFTQADTSTTRKYGGTGLGLTISIRLVKMMGGKMWVESQIGKGTEFHFAVPLLTVERFVQVGSIAPAGILRDVRVLIVDDNRTNRRILEGMLKRWEMRTTSVEGGEEGITQLLAAWEAGDPFALIISDLLMPKMDGFDFIERIQRKPEISTAMIMLLTSAGCRGDAIRCEELGVSAYLMKPVRQSELCEAIARVLGARGEKGTIPLITRYALADARDPVAFLRVLVAEDNPVNQRLAARLLEKRGHRVTVTANGRDAVQAIQKQTYDLILMDVQMPEMDGFEATRAIREMEKRSGTHIPIIALTAHAMKGDRERCLVAGMDGYLSKPIRSQEPDELLETYLARRVATLQLPETAGQLK